MKKKAGTFFKSVLSKGKNILKKGNIDSSQNDFEDNGLEEDNDIIEVGKQTLNKITNIAGSTLQVADSYLHSNSVSTSMSKDLKNDLAQICFALSDQRESCETDGGESLEIKNKVYFSDLTESDFESLQYKNQRNGEESKTYESTSKETIKHIDFIIVVGFHHKVGSQVEFIHPPINEDKEENLSAEFLKQLPVQALPDGSHLTEGGFVNFLMSDEKNTYHCVSCFRQIAASELPQEDSISRTFVQKAVIALTKIPIYGEIRAKLYPTTQAYFAQKNFKDTKILEDLYQHANSFGKGLVKDYSVFYTGLNLKQILLLPNFNVLTILKLLLLEGRIIVYSSQSSRVSNFLYSLIAFFPGNISFKYKNSDAVLHFLRSIKGFGLPLQIFNQDCIFLPLCTLYDTEKLDQYKGYLIGTTNQLFLNYPKAKADLVINLDNEKLDFVNEKAFNIKIARSHTNYEKKMIGGLMQNMEFTEEYQRSYAEDKPSQYGVLKKQDQNDTNGLININEQDQYSIKLEFKKYFMNLTIQLALAQKIEQEFQQSYSPIKLKRLGPNVFSDSDSDKEEQIKQKESQTQSLLQCQQFGQFDSDEEDTSYMKQFQEEETAEKEPKQEMEIDKNKISYQKQEVEETKNEEKKKSKNSSNKLDKVEKFSQKIKEVKEYDKAKFQKMSKLKKQTMKAVLGYKGIFNLKFLSAWTKRRSFRIWIDSFDKKISFLSPQGLQCNSLSIYYENGDYYTGSVQNGIRRGEGIYYEQSSGLTYNGEWLNDMKNGNGNLSSANLDYVYDGEFEDGQKNGQGQLITSGQKYSGGWKNDKYHKFGVLVMNDGTVYEGDWNMGEMQGMGQLKLSDGSVYIGEFSRGIFNGKGQLKYGENQAEIFNGEFLNGVKHGQGSYISADQNTQFVGEWENNFKNGPGTLIIKVEERVKEVIGVWRDDELQLDRVEVVVKEKGQIVEQFKGPVDKEFNLIQQ